MKTIELTKGYQTIVDDADYDALMQYSWHAHVDRNRMVYASTSLKRQDGTRPRLFMHNLLMGKRTGFTADHKNRNGVDNQRENLRWATRAQNMSNRIFPVGVSGFRGVQPSQGSGKWRVFIKKDKKTRYGGTYSDPRDAAIKYDALARELHGNFAMCNFPTN